MLYFTMVECFGPVRSVWKEGKTQTGATVVGYCVDIASMLQRFHAGDTTRTNAENNTYSNYCHPRWHACTGEGVPYAIIVAITTVIVTPRRALQPYCTVAIRFDRANPVSHHARRDGSTILSLALGATDLQHPRSHLGGCAAALGIQRNGVAVGQLVLVLPRHRPICRRYVAQLLLDVANSVELQQQKHDPECQSRRFGSVVANSFR